MTQSLTEVDSDVWLATLARCREVSIRVVGDLMLDEYVTGAVERISPEAPVPVLHAAETEFRLGGAANVARQIAALGASVNLIGVVGEDEAGERLCNLCEQSGISTGAILRSGHRKTTRKLRIVSQSQQLLRIDWEERGSLSAADSQALIEKMGHGPFGRYHHIERLCQRRRDGAVDCRSQRCGAPQWTYCPGSQASRFHPLPRRKHFDAQFARVERIGGLPLERCQPAGDH